MSKGSITDDSNIEIRNWFESFISNITVDKLMMETETAPQETADFYKDIITNKPSVHSYARISSTVYFIEHILKDYLKELSKFNKKPQKLAFDFSDAKILVWAQVENDDEQTEDALILSEAKANDKYFENGFYISSTIVEEADNLPIPYHYSLINFN